MRITNMMQLNDALASQSRASQQMYELTNEATSGLKIASPSDDPAGYASVVSGDAQVAQLQARSTAITGATGDLNLADGALASAEDLMAQAKQIAIEAADGTQSASDRANSATQITQIAQQLVGLGNTQGSSGYIFGGTQTGSPPFSSTGAFTGNGGATQVEIATGVLVQSNASGADAFTAAGGRDVLGDLQNLASALSSNNVAGIQSSLDNIDAGSTQITNARVAAGISATTLQSSSAVISSSLTAVQTAVAGESNADIPTVYSELTQAQTSYESAISVNRQILAMFQATQGA
jgi:flagellar hook-associated protein 3 FlgL